MADFVWESVPQLVTLRLSLRGLTQHDRQDLFAIYGDPAVMQSASDPAFPDLTYVDQMLRSVADLFETRQSIEWGITRREKEQVIGTCGLHSFDWETRAAEIGCLLRRADWGQSLMREALEAVIDFGFRELALTTIRAEIDVPNTRSIALFQRLGFQLEQGATTIYVRHNATSAGE